MRDSRFPDLTVQPFTSFDDLNFQPHPVGQGIQALLKLPNEIVLSVVGGPYFYGDGEETFEMAAFDQAGNFIQLDEYDDVAGHLSKEEVEEKARSLAARDL
jgi:hypothetical protein